MSISLALIANDEELPTYSCASPRIACCDRLPCQSSQGPENGALDPVLRPDRSLVVVAVVQVADIAAVAVEERLQVEVGSLIVEGARISP
jgi:hypothetical protein